MDRMLWQTLFFQEDTPLVAALVFALWHLTCKCCSVFRNVGCEFIAYNLRRIINIVSQDDLKKFFRELVFYFLQIFVFVKAFISPESNANCINRSFSEG